MRLSVNRELPQCAGECCGSAGAAAQPHALCTPSMHNNEWPRSQMAELARGAAVQDYQHAFSEITLCLSSALQVPATMP